MDVLATESASRKLGAEKALELATGASELVVAKGQRITTLVSSKGRADDHTILEHMLGPTGNLRAPTIVRGKTVLVGFNEAVYQRAIVACP